MKKYINNQEGRSMIEMLGVLAIVGVLSVAGIQGYSKAMAKYKTNKAMDQISTLAANIKTMFASLGNYKGLGEDGTTRSYNLGLLPEDMTKTCTGDVSADATGCVKNAFSGAVTVEREGDDTDGYFEFSIKFEGLTKDACTAIVTSDWGNASGFSGILVGADATEPTLNVSVTDAVTACGADDGANEITLVFK
jgi:Tfp pilus assembly protein PilE